MEWNSGQVWNPNWSAWGKSHVHPGFLLGSVFKTKVHGSKHQQRAEQNKQIRIRGCQGSWNLWVKVLKSREQRRGFRNLQNVPLESCLNTGTKLCSHRIRLWGLAVNNNWGLGDSGEGALVSWTEILEVTQHWEIYVVLTYQSEETLLNTLNFYLRPQKSHTSGAELP